MAAPRATGLVPLPTIPMPEDRLQIALEHHRSGRATQAEAAYRAALEHDPDQPDALHWLGVLIFQAGRPREALLLLRRAAALRPGDAAFQHNLAQACLAVGQLDEAVAALRAADDADPGRPEALAALGAARLRRRAPGDAERAVVAFRQAHAAGRDTPELHHDLGVALLLSGLPDEARAAFAVALARKPDYASAFYHQALAHRAKGEAKEVRKCLNKALEADPELARAWYALGVLDAEAGNGAQAVASFRKAVRLKGDYADAYQALGHTLRKMGRAEESLRALRQAVRASRGRIGGQADAPAGAAGAREAPAQVPAEAISEEAVEAAVAAMERKLALTPAAAELHYALATLTHVTPPAKVPAFAVQNLFDTYADQFDSQLRDGLHYRAPELIVEAITRALSPAAGEEGGELLGRRPSTSDGAGDEGTGEEGAGPSPARSGSGTSRLSHPINGDKPPGVTRGVLPAAALGGAVDATPSTGTAGAARRDVLDLGCGTGLCGPLLRPLASTLAGVDLSPGMLEKARARGVYDRLELGELVEALRRAPRAYDLLVSADVLIYLGDLAPAFEAAAAALRPGGLLAFSVEAAGGDRYTFNPQTRRFAHSQPYLRRLAAMYGLEEVSFEASVPRFNAGQPVPGYVVVLRSPPGAGSS